MAMKRNDAPQMRPMAEKIAQSCAGERRRGGGRRAGVGAGGAVVTPHL